MAVYLHGKTAELYVEKNAEECMIPRDIIRLFPKVLKEFIEEKEN